MIPEECGRIALSVRAQTHLLLVVVAVRAPHDNLEDGVAPARYGIRVGRFRLATEVALSKKREELLLRLNAYVAQSGDDGAVLRILAELERLRCGR